MYKLSFFVPEVALDGVKSALFAAGAGKIGLYEQCCWQVKGRGQFRPLAGSDPAIGAKEQLEVLDEWKVELVCEESLIKIALSALIKSHPYEEVAYQVVRLVDPESLP